MSVWLIEQDPSSSNLVKPEQWKITRYKGHAKPDQLQVIAAQKTSGPIIYTKDSFVEVKKDAPGDQNDGLIRVGPWSMIYLEKPYNNGQIVLTIEPDKTAPEAEKEFSGAYIASVASGHFYTRSTNNKRGSLVFMKPDGLDPATKKPLSRYIALVGLTTIYTFDLKVVPPKRKVLALLDPGEMMTLFNPYSDTNQAFVYSRAAAPSDPDPDSINDEAEFRAGFKLAKVKFEQLDKLGPFFDSPDWIDIDH